MAKSSATSYEIRYRKTSDADLSWSGPLTAGADGKVAIPNLDREQGYQFQARAVSACGARSAWADQTHVVSADSAPVAVDALTAQSLADGVHLGWATEGIQPANVEYAVERADAVSGPFGERARVRGTAYTDPETSGTTRYYRVRAVNTSGAHGGYSPVVSSNGVAVNAIAGQVAQALQDAQTAQAAADGKIQSFYQSSAPSGGQSLGVGDLWFDTDDGNKPYRWSGSAWAAVQDTGIVQALQAASDAQAAADGKVTTFFSTVAPTAGAVGDLWFNVSTQELLRWNGSSWDDRVGDVTESKTTVPVVNPGFDAGDTGWSKSSGWTIQSDGQGPGAGKGYARKSSGTQDSAIRNNGRIFVVPGQVYRAQALVQAIGANGGCCVRISWRNTSDNEIGFASGNLVSGTKTTGSYVVAVAPSSATFAHVELATYGHTSGEYRCDNVVTNFQASSADEVPESGTRKWAGEAGATKNKADSYLMARGNHTGTQSASTVDETSIRRWAAESGATKNKADSYLVARSNHTGTQSASTVSETSGRKWAAESGADKTIDHTAGTGTNLLPEQYTRFPTGSGLPPLSHGGTGSTAYISSQFGVTTAGSWLAFKCNTDYAADCQRFSNGGNFPLYLEPGCKYIFSAYVTTTYSGQAKADFGIMYSDGSYVFTAVKILTSGSTSRTRISAVLDLTNGKKLPCHFCIRPNRAGIVGSVQYFDGLMLERMVGNDTSPSTWVPGPSELGRMGSGARLGDPRNQAAVTVANYGSAWQGLGITYSASSTSVTVTVSAADLQIGSTVVHYNSSSITRSGSPGQHITLYLYYQDPSYLGGSKTLHGSVFYVNSINDDGSVYIGELAIAYPTSGSGSGGGPVGGCVTVDSVLPGHARAGDVAVGEMLEIADPVSFMKRYGRVSHAETCDQPCVRIRTASGVELECSTSAPIATESGELVRSPDLPGCRVPVCDHGEWRIEEVTSVEHIGVRQVRHITCENDVFLAGREHGRYLLHHNLKQTTLP